MPTTSPDSLFYPDDASGPDLTQHLQDLADNVQSVFTASETWTSWTPNFDTPTNGGFTSLGTGGTKSGHYRRSRPGSGALIYAEFRFKLGTSPTRQNDGGATRFIFVLLLPVTAYLWAGQNQNQNVGRWTMRDDSGPIGGNPVSHQSGTLNLFSSTNGLSVHFADGVDAAAPINSGTRIDDRNPITTWAVDDVLTGHLLYRAA